MPTALLLSAYEKANTADPEELRASFARMYGRPVVDFPGRDRTFHAVINQCSLEHIELNYGTYAGNLELIFPESGFVSQIFPIRGRGEAIVAGHTRSADCSNSILVSANTPVRIRSDADYERLVVCIRSDALLRSLAALTGKDISAPIKMAPSQSVIEASGRLLRDHALFLARQLSDPGSLHPAVVKEFEAGLIAMSLRANRHSHSHLLEEQQPAAGPSTVRLAEDFIAANHDQPITIETLADVTGVGVLSLFRAFKSQRGYSPRELLQRLRAENGKTGLGSH